MTPQLRRVPYVLLDATQVKARVDHQAVSRAVGIATDVTAEGDRVVLGVDVGDREYPVFWAGLFTSLNDRGHSDVDSVIAVISGGHRGQKASICKAMQESA